ncbi:hypothetical protein [Govanella unica]|uniref:Uncharacterized protein n=1 Tax=Govanella unica TaxID=2975056 RepID=A0A9X3Z827_9PROT|nr:hypothetical protein [Govania unica]MDA5194658.1 hypothetical protein [Govania unica]
MRVPFLRKWAGLRLFRLSGGSPLAALKCHPYITSINGNLPVEEQREKFGLSGIQGFPERSSIECSCWLTGFAELKEDYYG